MHAADAFLLLSLPKATLERNGTSPVTGSLYLECVTIQAKNSPFPDRDVYLVIKLGREVEIPVDPSRRVTASTGRDSHLYTFMATASEPAFSFSIPFSTDPVASQDLETFNHILTQYVTGFSEEREKEHVPLQLDRKIQPPSSSDQHEYGDLRGHLVLVNESDGSVLGELDHEFEIKEDLSRDLPPDAPVLIELPPDYDTATADRAKVPGQEFVPLTSRQAFARAVPPEEQDALTSTATLISHAISATTTLLISGISSASKYYVANSRPHTPSPSPGPSNPHRGIVISNPMTRSALTQAHMVSGKAVSVSAKTIEVVDSLIKKAVGRKEKPTPRNPPNTPPREGGNRAPPKPTLRKRDKLILSADVVFSTLEESIFRIVDTGSEEITRIVAHKHGEESGQNASLATGTARNVALVYVDLKGVMRKAIISRVGKEYVKAKLSSGNSNRPRLDRIAADHAAQHRSPSNVPTASVPKPPLPPRRSHEKK